LKILGIFNTQFLFYRKNILTLLLQSRLQAKSIVNYLYSDELHNKIYAILNETDTE